MSKARRAAIAAYKDRKPSAGIFALRGPAGAVWVGSSVTLDTIENRHGFTLRQGSHPNKALQAAWTSADEGAFSFEVLERLDPETSEISQSRLLKERLATWQAHLGAHKL